MTNGAWLGDLDGITVREPGPDADGPILELHGTENMAAVCITDDDFIDQLTRSAVELDMAMDDGP